MSDPITDAISGSMADAGMIEETPVVDSTPEPVAEPAADTPNPAAAAQAASEVTPPAAEPKPKTDDEVLAEIEKELVAKNPSLQRGQMGMSRHQAVLTRRTRDHEAAVAKLKAEYDGKLKEWDNETTRDRLAAFELAEKKPQDFFERVLMNDQRYRALVDAKVEAILKEKGAPAATAAAPTPSAAPPETKRPEPDVLLADGTLGYSADAQLQLIAFEVEQRAAAIEAKYNEKFGALDKDLQPVRDFKAEAELKAQSFEKMSTLVDEARSKWPVFTENEGAIKTLLAVPGNERMTLRQAYDKVVYGGLQHRILEQQRAIVQAETTARAKLLAEMNKNAPSPGLRAGTLPVPGGQSAEPVNRDDALRDVVARAASRLAS